MQHDDYNRIRDRISDRMAYWFRASGVDFWDECDAPHELTSSR